MPLPLLLQGFQQHLLLPFRGNTGPDVHCNVADRDLSAALDGIDLYAVATITALHGERNPEDVRFGIECLVQARSNRKQPEI